ncbi:MAG: MFS transporter, partial [Verrucomicrobiota bacterium]
RGGQRRHLLWFCFFLPALGLVLIFAPNSLMAPGLRWTLLSLGMLVFFIGYTFYAIPYWSLIDDYSGDDESRKRHLSNLLGAGILLATAIGFVLTPIAIDRLGFFKAAIVFALPALVLMILPYFAAPIDVKPTTSRPDTAVDFWTGFVASFKHRRFIALVIIFAGSQMSFAVLSSATPFIASGLLGGTDADVGRLMTPFIGTALPSFIIIPWLSRRFGWKPLIVWSTLLLAGSYSLMTALGADLIGSPMTTAAILFGFVGPLAAILVALEGEAILACAREKEGHVTSVYFGVHNFIIKAANGLAVYLTGHLGELATHSEHGEKAIRAMPGLAGACLAVGLVLYFLIRPKEEK